MRYDLNLLPVFVTLMEERNVTRAAQRLGMTQPALSNALARLRVTLGDRGLKDGIVEIQARRDEQAQRIALSDALAHVVERLKSL